MAHGAITGGSSAGTSNIKLSKGGKGGGRRGGRRQPQQQQQQPPPQPPPEPRPEVTMAPDEPVTMAPDAPPPPPPCGTDSATLHIVEPPEGATVKGSSFDVRVAIEPCDTDLFNESYAGPTSRVCVALDSSPYYCWPVVGGRIRFAGAVDGQHAVTAVLMRQGRLLPETETGEVVGEEGDIDLDKREEQVTLGIPNLEMILPFEKVTLPGSQLTVVSRVKTADEDRAKFDEKRN
ncbi:hypothetical protein TeGR_g5622 [Tetraparma gracilis]|uniref:Uncharacterized protein n=1 Tax=Tetraparma gracilis TaxID=2962635 RepID=A0ABQ6NBA7_9STRA|nr:hypothetical protein TeGR_g5622 [Tetraparma gracilis]